VYVLGASTPGDRRRYEAHLGSCAACRGEVTALAGLPGLLRRLNAAEAEGAGAAWNADPDPEDGEC
jgi:anti-sigma factor RsiW